MAYLADFIAGTPTDNDVQKQELAALPLGWALHLHGTRALGHLAFHDGKLMLDGAPICDADARDLVMTRQALHDYFTSRPSWANYEARRLITDFLHYLDCSSAAFGLPRIHLPIDDALSYDDESALTGPIIGAA